MADKFEQTSSTTREFTLEFLQQITDNFSEGHKIGSGGYGVVYKGVLENGEEIALKKLHHMPGLDDAQFRNEFNHLMRIHHPNITRLVGYCYNLGHQRFKYGGEYIFALVEERVLCFEYLQGGSLDKHISDESCGLDWHTRFKIIKGVCAGLNYLHNGCKDPVYHLDLKPANILLDTNMVPKIGDFGLSRLFPSTQTYITVKIIGTPGYMPPEYIERHEITSKYDVFSLGVIIVRIMAGDEGYSKCAHMSTQEFLEHVHENWEKRLQATMSFHTSEQVRTCIEIALRCVEVDREKRPTIAEIVDELKKVDTPESLLTCQVAKNQNWNSERRGRITFSTTNKPLVPLDIFSCPFSPSSIDDELRLTDGVSYNYNGRAISPPMLKTVLKSLKLTNEVGAIDEGVDAGHISGLIFVSERDDGLETLYIAVRSNDDSKVKVFSLADIFGIAKFSGVRLEDSGCIGGGYSVGSRFVDHSLIYISTKEPAPEELVPEWRRSWTATYITNLTTGKTECLTPPGASDLSPAVSPSGRMVAVASYNHLNFRSVENLQTDIYVMDVDSEGRPGRTWKNLLIMDGGWPSWGSDNIIFFHRRSKKRSWSVYQYNISTKITIRVTPEEFNSVTPAAISETKVAVATIRQNYDFRSAVQLETQQYRHIEIFDIDAPGLPPIQITQKTMPESDHYNPFVLHGGDRIGYHRCRSPVMQQGDQAPWNLHKTDSAVKDVGLFSVSGTLPAISKDGSKLAFIDDSLKTVWVASSEGLCMVFKRTGPDNVFHPVWNQNPDKDILYVCIGTSYADGPLEIYAIQNASGPAIDRKVDRLTLGGFNNAFPSSSPDGNKLVFRSTRRGVDEKKCKNLYIMVDAEIGEFGQGWVTQLTKGSWTDTHCQWSPNTDWIVFSSTREMYPKYMTVYLVKAYDPTVVIRVMHSDGSVNHPVFSPDGRSIAVMADLAAVSVDPISLPKLKHTLQPYGDIFVVDIDPDDSNKKNKDVIKGFRRMTHSRYLSGMLGWTKTLLWTDPRVQAKWNMLPRTRYGPFCSYFQGGRQNRHRTRHPYVDMRPRGYITPFSMCLEL